MTKDDRSLLSAMNVKLESIEKWTNKIEKKLDDHIINNNCGVQRELTDHKNRDHKTMWIFIIGIPAFIGFVITLITFLK